MCHVRSSFSSSLVVDGKRAVEWCWRRRIMRMQEMEDGVGDQVLMDTFKLNPQARMKVRVSGSSSIFCCMCLMEDLVILDCGCFSSSG